VVDGVVVGTVVGTVVGSDVGGTSVGVGPATAEPPDGEADRPREGVGPDR
jgi:hypothetical protein